MAVAYTVTNVLSTGHMKAVSGTFTTAAGDGNAESLGPSVHGLNYLVNYVISLDPGAIEAPNPRLQVSGGTITWNVDDTNGLSGRFFCLGKP